MNWIFAGFAMFMSSVALYLLVRKSVLMRIPSQQTNLAMFLIPSVFFILYGWGTQTSFAITPYQFLILAILAIFFSYLGNVFSLKSIEHAPNPGYSLVISKSYVLFTTLVSIPLFSSTLTQRSALAIILILVGSVIITLSGKATPAKHVRASWLPLSIGAFFCWGLLTLTSKYLLLLGVNVVSRIVYSMAIVSGLIMLEMRQKGVSVRNIKSGEGMVLLFIGLLSGAFNYFMQEGFATAPNIGYINALNASSIGLVVVGSAILFKDEFSIRKFVGVLIIITGIVLLVI